MSKKRNWEGLVVGGLALGLTCGCANVVAQQRADEAKALGEQSCGRPAEDKETGKQRPLTVPELVAKGDALRDNGLGSQAASEQGIGGSAPLTLASDCYGRALQLAPESYEASLGLGVAYVGRARNEAQNKSRKAGYLASAKRMLGMAYMLRRGNYEPLYYLAEVAVIEEDYARARGYLEELRKANYRPGPVAALIGYLAEKQGDTAGAAASYEVALTAGWPSETVEFVARRLKD